MEAFDKASMGCSQLTGGSSGLEEAEWMEGQQYVESECAFKTRSY